jgi:hypothetical protein
MSVRAACRALGLLLCSGSSEECRQGWPAALAEALCGGEVGSTGRVAGIGRKPIPFRQRKATAWMPELRQRRGGRLICCRKARPRLTNLPGRRPGKRQAECRFLLVVLFWTSKREVPCAPQAHEMLLILSPA